MRLAMGRKFNPLYLTVYIAYTGLKLISLLKYIYNKDELP